VGGDTGNQPHQAEHPGNLMLLHLQQSKLDNHEEEIRSIEGSHPPDIGGGVGGEHIIDGHAPGVFNLEPDHEKTGDNGDDGHEHRTFGNGLERLKAKDMTDGGNQTQPG